MVDRAGILNNIAAVAFRIRYTVERVRQNEEECRRLEQGVSRVYTLLSNLEGGETMNDMVMAGQLEDFRQTFCRAYDLVKACQGKNVMCLYFSAGNLSKQFRQIHQDIIDDMQMLNFRTTTAQTVMFTRLNPGVHLSTSERDAVTPASPQDNAPKGESSNINHSTENMMDVSKLGELTQIVELTVMIEYAADTVKQHQEEWHKIGVRMHRIRAVLLLLESTEMTKNLALSNSLEDLKATLLQAHWLVKKCQEEKNIMCLCFSDGNMTKQLHRINGDIMERITVITLNFGNQISNTITLVTQEQSVPAGSESPVLSCFTKFSFSELEAATNNFSGLNKIGQDDFATVYKGLLPDGTGISIKKFHDTWGQQSVRQYLRVFSVQLEHENVVPFIGYCDEEKREMLVEKFMPGKSLLETIDDPEEHLEWPTRFHIILGVAEGVAYLHTKNIVHLDLSPANIVLVGPDKNPMICDFKISKIVDRDVIKTVKLEFEGTLGYMAPEYTLDGKISVKNDVFSFGDLLCAISGTSRYGPPQDLQDLAKVVREARRMKELFDPSSCSGSQLKEIKRCGEVGLMCIKTDPSDRPTMEEALRMLKDDKL